MAKLHIHPIGLGLILFGLLSWVVALGGIAACTQFCRTQEDVSTTNTTTSTNGTVSSTYWSKDVKCAQEYQLEWWSVWFEFFLLVIMLGTCFVNAFDKARFIYLTYLALVSVLLTQASTNFITNSFENYSSTRTQKESALNAAAAGTVLLCITNYALIIFVGLGAAAAQMGGLNLSAPEAKYQPSNF